MPDAPISSARDDGVSGIRFYRIPDDAVLLDEIEGGGIEFIQRHHRFAIVWPSINVKIRRQYRWSGKDIPYVNDLPWLP